MGKKVLILTPLFGPGVRSAPLADELVRALVQQGHDVHVLVLDWSGQSGGKDAQFRSPHGALVDVIAPPDLYGARFFVARTVRAAAGLVKGYWRTRSATRGQTYDTVFAFTIATALLGPILAARSRARWRQLFVTDCYPFHNIAIGTLPGSLLGLGKVVESMAFRQFDRLLCISPEWIRFLRQHYRLTQLPCALLPLWTQSSPLSLSDPQDVLRRHGLPSHRIIAVFGGQLAPGRGIAELVDAALASRYRLPEVLFLFVGSGPLQSLVQGAAADNPDRIAWIGALPHDDYLALISASQIGLVSLAPHIDAPAFPSKSLDYLRAGLPIVAAGRPGSDFLETIEALGIGIGVPAGDSDAIVAAVARCASPEMRAIAAQRASDALRTHFSAAHAATIAAGGHAKVGE